jgi:glycerate-2-kinase
MDHRFLAEQLFLAAIESVLPARLIAGKMSVADNYLLFGDHTFSLDSFDNIYILGAGKASALMGAEVEKILGSRIAEGHIVVKYGHSCKLNYIKVSEAGHPVPDLNGHKATEVILNIATKAGKNDLVIVLLSGGGSSLLADYPEGTSLKDIKTVNDLLIKSGASIHEINAVRKHLSNVKGGHLARAVCPATLVSLILSDVVGDPPDVIASGPTAPDPTTFQNALAVLGKFKISGLVPEGILKHLYEGVRGDRQETPKPGDAVFSKTINILVGTNKVALDAVRQKAIEFNINSVIIDDELQGDVYSVAEYIVDKAVQFKLDKNEVKPVCLLFGGETTVEMTGSGKGGRNQHLALLCANILNDNNGITILCGGTDGTDGPTDAAGAVVDSESEMIALSKGIDPLKYIREFDSYNFFKKCGGHIKTGPTMTNVMDIIIVLIH